MNILVVGSGGREHAIIKKLKESPLCTQIFCAPGNGGIAADAQCLAVAATDLEGMKAAALAHRIDLCVVAPDDPLVLGMVDLLEEAGIPCFGPRKNAAIIEGSKAFSKALMQKYAIPTADYQVFEDFEAACRFVKEKNSYPCVVKADGLALGKGVIIAENEAEALEALRQILCDKAFGDNQSRVVIEEFLTGTELSVLAFTDGKTLVPLASAMDHKRAHDNDQGLNTGGMGAVAPHPMFDADLQKICYDTIFMPTVHAMNAEGRTFCGCLYFGLMLTKNGPKVIEYNCRFGDPETQVVLPLLEGDLVAIMLAVRNQTLDTVRIAQKQGSAACVVVASGGYPQSYQKGFVLEGLDENGQAEGIFVCHAGTKRHENRYLSNGGRVLGLCATAPTLKGALDQAYAAAKAIKFENSFFRSDIGKKLL